jgi:hypothetical protein
MVEEAVVEAVVEVVVVEEGMTILNITLRIHLHCLVSNFNSMFHQAALSKSCS